MSAFTSARSRSGSPSRRSIFAPHVGGAPWAGAGPVLAAGVAYAAGDGSFRGGERRSRFQPAGSPRVALQRKHLPNVPLVTHDGERVRFYDDLVKEKKVVLTFVSRYGSEPEMRWAHCQSQAKARVLAHSMVLDFGTGPATAASPIIRRFGTGSNPATVPVWNCQLLLKEI